MNKFLEVTKAFSSMHIYIILPAFTYSKNKLNSRYSLTSLEKATHRALSQLICYYFYYLYLRPWHTQFWEFCCIVELRMEAKRYLLTGGKPIIIHLNKKYICCRPKITSEWKMFTDLVFGSAVTLQSTVPCALIVSHMWCLPLSIELWSHCELPSAKLSNSTNSTHCCLNPCTIYKTLNEHNENILAIRLNFI